MYIPTQSPIESRDGVLVPLFHHRGPEQPTEIGLDYQHCRLGESAATVTGCPWEGHLAGARGAGSGGPGGIERGSATC